MRTFIVLSLIYLSVFISLAWIIQQTLGPVVTVLR